MWACRMVSGFSGQGRFPGPGCLGGERACAQAQEDSTTPQSQPGMALSRCPWPLAVVSKGSLGRAEGAAAGLAFLQ